MKAKHSVLLTIGLTGMIQGAASAQCIAPDNGFGTATMPAVACTYFTFDDNMRIIDGLPVGDTIEINARIDNFFNVTETPGGSLGGTFSTYDAQLVLPMTGTGSLAGFNRFISMPLSSIDNRFDCAPRISGDPVQSFANDMIMLTGEVFGDPDFCTLRVKAGAAHGLGASPGNTLLTMAAANLWHVESFFDITYTIEFQGCPGSVLEGFSGTTELTVRFSTDPCPEDLNNDGVTNSSDLAILIGNFGTPGPIGDINGDGIVNSSDLGLLIGQFGQVCNPV